MKRGHNILLDSSDSTKEENIDKECRLNVLKRLSRARNSDFNVSVWHLKVTWANEKSRLQILRTMPSKEYTGWIIRFTNMFTWDLLFPINFRII